MALGWRKEYLRYQLFFLNIVNLYKQREDLKMFLEILLSLLTISIFGAFALRPTILTITQLIKDIKAKEEIVVKMEEKIKNLEIAQTLLEDESASLPIVHSSVPSFPQPDVFARQIEALSAKNSVTILAFSIDKTTLLGKPPAPKSSKELKPLPQNSSALEFSLSVKGNYSNLFNFLQETENLRIPVLIDSAGLNLSKLQEEKFLTLVVSGRTPYLGLNPEK